VSAMQDWFLGWTLSDKIAAIASAAAAFQFIGLIVTIWVTIVNGRRQLRAYVFPEEVGIIDGTMLNPPNPIHFNKPGVVLSFPNSGQTPAYHVVSWAQIEVIEPKDENSLTVPRLKRIFERPIGANGKMPKAIWFGRVLSPAEIADIGTGKKVIYLHGRLEYRDAFKRKRYSNYRLAYAGKFPPPPNVGMSFTQSGNSAN
jgi:hypothetical protein